MRPIRMALAAALTACPSMALAQGSSSSDNRGETELARRIAPLLPSLRGALAGNDADAQRAALAVIETTPPSALYGADLARALQAFLMKDVNDPDMIVRGLRAFGKSFPEGAELARVLAKHGTSENIDVRRAAAEALNSSVQNAAAGRTSVSSAYVADLGSAARPMVEIVLLKGDSASRREALQAVQTVASRLSETYTFDAGPGSIIRDIVGLIPRIAGAQDFDEPDTLSAMRRYGENLALLRRWAVSGRVIDNSVRSVADLSKSMAPSLADSDPATRAEAVRTVSAIGNLRRTVHTARKPTPTEPGPFSDAPLRSIIPTLTERVSDPGADSRLAAITAIESIGDLPGTTEAFLKGSTDSTIAVRWTAARALGIQAVRKTKDKEAVDKEVAALAKLAGDPDLDVRAAALSSLEKFGAAALPATPSVLAAARTGDVEPRLQALKAVTAIKTPAAETVPVLVEGLNQNDLRLRRAAATGLVRFKEEAAPALPALRLALESPDPELRVAATEAILAINPQKRLSPER